MVQFSIEECVSTVGRKIVKLLCWRSRVHAPWWRQGGEPSLEPGASFDGTVCAAHHSWLPCMTVYGPHSAHS